MTDVATDANPTPRTFPCGACGASLVFAPGQQVLHCEHCDYERPIAIPDGEVSEQDFYAMLQKLAQQPDAALPSDDGLDSEVTCKTCGATVVFAGTLTASHCSYCGGSISRDHVHRATHRVPAHGVLPFAISETVAADHLGKWVKSRWFAPGAFKKRGAQGEFSGVYLPYWTYDAMTHNQYRGERGEHYYVTVGSGDNERRERRTRWYPAGGQFSTFFNDVVVSAVKRLPAKLLESLEPWPFESLIPFTPEVMAGFLAQTYDVELADGYSVAKEKMARAIDRETRRHIGGDDQRVHRIETQHAAVTFKHLLLPVWLMAYRYGDKSFQVSINACTGRVMGERPYSVWKIAFFTLFIMGLVAALVVLLQTR